MSHLHHLRHLLCTLLFAGASTCSYASPTCTVERVIFSINGVLTSLDEAQMNSDLLQDRYRSAYPFETASPKFKVLYNPSGKKYGYGAGGAIDFIEVLMQRTGLSISRLLRMLAGLEPIPEQYRATIADVLSKVAVMGYNPDSTTLANMLAGINSDIGQGSKVLLVAHSQGNLWANSLLTLITDPQRRAAVSQIGIAVPDSRLEKSAVPHVTLTEDWVIKAVPFALPANVSNGYNLYQIYTRTLGHNFVRAYMESGRPSGQTILNAVRNSFASLRSISHPGGQGPFTVTLTWGAQPDVDLHVFEPDGKHVYYAAMSGNAGYLDIDDVSSYGPEHYFASCQSIVTGEYQVGVNYFNGAAPETATVFIQAGTISLTRRITLPTARGVAGNDQPIPVAKVNIQRNPSTGEIEGAIIP